jgi:hypothetical protein
MRRVRVTDAGKPPGFLSHKQGYIVFWLLGLGLLAVYATALYIERTAPVNPVTGFHVSFAGAYLLLFYPALSALQTVCWVVGLCLVCIGLIGKREWIAPGANVVVFALAMAILNYLTSL